jgi:sugar/nucleoside kinase (ribokinase family)
MKKQYDILVAGEINPDIILSGDVEPAFGQVEKLVEKASLTVGSSSAILACGASRLGLKVGFIGRCSDDMFGRFVLEEMQKAGIDTRPVIVVPGSSTGLSVILTHGNDRAILTYPGLIPTLTAEDISDELLARSRHLHVASYFLQTALQPGLRQLFERAQREGLTTSLDTNYDPSEGWQGVNELLTVTNVFLPNEVEVCSLTRSQNVDHAVGKLVQRVETLVVKQGVQGAIGVKKGERVKVNSLNVEVQDTVGAGDSFDAGFLYGYLNHWSLKESLRLAVVCGGLSTRATGGTAGQPTLSEATAWMERLPES